MSININIRIIYFGFIYLSLFGIAMNLLGCSYTCLCRGVDKTHILNRFAITFLINSLAAYVADLLSLAVSNSFSVRENELLGVQRPPQDSCAGLWPSKIS